ncbi:C6 finger domain protein [Golovinomyces cichoracearum]|uniref:C6 finger domain protein n=1 Tax=Golovinomyces cichoracearum TaxID=62708 RepID=A0A420IBK6_9PEZI|nr:C6 finger domain protein [Golovinomyces cichoracearum]
MDVRDIAQRKSAPSNITYNKDGSSKTECKESLLPSDSQAPKSVAFELLFTSSPQHRARIPMRVQIYPHDTTDSIVTTVKNFYGLYCSPNCMKGVCFEDEEGNTLIARYENFRNNMIVYVRVINEPIPTVGLYVPSAYLSGSAAPQSYYTSDTHQTLPPPSAHMLSCNSTLSRPTSRTSQKHDCSPNKTNGRRSISANANSVTAKKSRSRSGFKGRGYNLHGNSVDSYNDSSNGYSSEDEAPGSTLAKTKSEQIGSTEISLDNIVEGGRRKRAKFESSELPLFAPTQMPAATSNSSISPARRSEHQRPVIYSQSNPQYHFSNPQLLESPRGIQNGNRQTSMFSTPGAENCRMRGDPSNRQSINSTSSCNSSGIIPTPDPTVGSCMSEEDKDVALQLMRLGEFSNVSQGRTSASTLDDTFSGKADAASSTGATSECGSDIEFDIPINHKIKREANPALASGVMKKNDPHPEYNLTNQDNNALTQNSAEYEEKQNETSKAKMKEASTNELLCKSTTLKAKCQATAIGKSRVGTVGTKCKSSKLRSQRASQSKTKKSASNSKPISPASMPPHSRKTSNSSSTFNFKPKICEDEEDLSTKPRCQRCRKSKKGCDRQRPCQRCKDAGLSADQCVSEDEGNGRKGRYGRHMGVPVKKNEQISESTTQSSVAQGNHCSPSKKRKR